MPTLQEALKTTAMARWQGRRCYATNMSQAERAVGTLQSLGVTTLAQASTAAVKQATAEWYRLGLSPTTINKRLNCLSAMGVKVEGCRVHEPKVLKWWLNPEDHKNLCRWLRNEVWGEGEYPARPTPLRPENGALMADFVDWTVYTGLRVEETLGLQARHLVGGIQLVMSVTVPGLKTSNAQATLPLSKDAAAVAVRRLEDLGPILPGSPVFPFRDYDHLQQRWEYCRQFLGVSHVPGATLKALRRSAARYLHIQRGMPLDMLRQYLRHDDLQTTMGYLRLTGGYGEEEMRKWL